MQVDIVSVLTTMNRGQALDEIAREFRGVIDEVRVNNGVGEMTIKITVTPKAWDRAGNLSEVELSHSLSSKRPRRKLGASAFFIDGDGALSRNNPEQKELFDAHIEPQRSANDR